MNTYTAIIVQGQPSALLLLAGLGAALVYLGAMALMVWALGRKRA